MNKNKKDGQRDHSVGKRNRGCGGGAKPTAALLQSTAIEEMPQMISAKASSKKSQIADKNYLGQRV